MKRLAGLAWLAASAAHAGGNLLLIDPVPESATLAVGASVWRLPAGASLQPARTVILPSAEAYRASGLFASTDNGLGWNLSRSRETQWGLRLWPQLGVRAQDRPAGLGGVGTRLQVQAFANHAPFEALLLQSALAYGSGVHHDGAQLELGATSGIPLGAATLGIGWSVNYANQAFRQSYWGVSPQQAQASGLPARALAAGRQDSTITLSAEHKLGAHWRVDAQWLQSLVTRSSAGPLWSNQRHQRAGTLSLWRDL